MPYHKCTYECCLKEKMGDHFLKVCKNLELQLDCQLRSNLISFWSLQLWMLLSQLQNETQRLHQKPSCMSDAAYCNTSQLRWTLCPLWSCWKRLTFFFAKCFSPWSHYLSEMGSVVAHLTATGSNYEKYVDKMSAILSFFYHLCQTGKTAEGHELC